MKTLMYLFCVSFSSLLATRAQESAEFRGTKYTLVQTHQVMKDFFETPERAVQIIGSHWDKVYYMQENCGGYIEWVNWHANDYWELIDSLDYLGQRTCLWDFFTLHKWKPEFLQSLIDACPDQRFLQLVKKYFSTIKQDINDDQINNRPLQSSEWIVPLKILLKFKLSVFIAILEEEPKYSNIWLKDSQGEIFLEWVKLSPESLHVWMSAHWSDLQTIMTTMGRKFVFWQMILEASYAWIAKNLTQIAQVVSCHEAFFNNTRPLTLFIMKYPNLFLGLLVENSNLLESLITKKTEFIADLNFVEDFNLLSVLSSNYSLLIQMHRIYRCMKEQQLSAKQAFKQLKLDRATRGLRHARKRKMPECKPIGGNLNLGPEYTSIDSMCSNA